MKKIFFTALCLLLVSFCFNAALAQRVVFDRGHFSSVNENALIRTSAELSHSKIQQQIHESLERINLNSATVAAAQAVIHQSLANVNAGLKQGVMLRNMSAVARDVLDYGQKMKEMASDDPHLLLFSEQIFKDIYSRSLALLSDVSSFILKENAGILMDYNARDELLKKISNQLHILAGLSYGAWKAMYYGKQKNLFRALNPFEHFINQDRRLIQAILSDSKYLKR